MKVGVFTDDCEVSLVSKSINQGPSSKVLKSLGSICEVTSKLVGIGYHTERNNRLQKICKPG